MTPPDRRGRVLLRLLADAMNSGQLRDVADWTKVARYAQDLVAIGTQMPAAREALGLALLYLGRPAAALPHLEWAVKTGNRNFLDHWGLALLAAGYEAQALAVLQAAEAAVGGESSDGVFASVASALLASGNFVDGFRRLREVSHRRIQQMGPPWDGSPLPGKLLGVVSTGGAGSAIQFTRYLPRIAQTGTAILLFVEPSLVRLMTHMASGRWEVCSRSKQPLDAAATLLELPFLCGTRAMADIPPAPYLTVPPARPGDRVAGTLRIGFAWSARMEAWRTTPISAWRNLVAVPGTDWFCLRPDPETQEELKQTLGPCGIPSWDRLLRGLGQGSRRAGRALAAWGVHRTDRSLGDWYDTAQVVAGLDLVITVDTGLAHLAGALGVPTWLLLACPEWRWQAERETSPWYPSMRLFRHPRPASWGRDWTPVFATVHEALTALVSERATSPSPPEVHLDAT